MKTPTKIASDDMVVITFDDGVLGLTTVGKPTLKLMPVTRGWLYDELIFIEMTICLNDIKKYQVHTTKVT